MGLTGKRIVCISIAALTVVACITFGIFMFRNNDKEDKTPTETSPKESPTSPSTQSSSGSTYSTGSAYSTGSTANNKPSLGQGLYNTYQNLGKLDDDTSTGFGKSIKSYINAPPTAGSSNDDAQREAELKNLFRGALNKYCLDPPGDGTCGYFSIFATIYDFLRDPNHYVHKIFFDTTGYDDVLVNVPKPKGFASIADLFKKLKDNLNDENHVKTGRFSYVQHNKDNIMLAFKYLLLKHAWGDNAIMTSILVTRKDMGMDIPGHIIGDEADPRVIENYFKGEFACNYINPKAFLTNSRQFWLADDEITLWGLIFRVNIVSLFFRKPESKDSDNKVEFVPRVSGNVTVNGRYHDTPLERDFYIMQAFSDPGSIEWVYLIVALNNHFYALVDNPEI